MATAKDFKINSDNDLQITNGDFVIVESDSQNITDIITASKGDYKEYPLCGVGINSFINSNATQLFLNNEIVTQLTIDGFSNIDVIFNDNNSLDFTIDAARG